MLIEQNSCVRVRHSPKIAYCAHHKTSPQTRKPGRQIGQQSTQQSAPILVRGCVRIQATAVKSLRLPLRLVTQRTRRSWLTGMVEVVCRCIEPGACQTSQETGTETCVGAPQAVLWVQMRRWKGRDLGRWPTLGGRGEAEAVGAATILRG